LKNGNTPATAAESLEEHLEAGLGGVNGECVGKEEYKLLFGHFPELCRDHVA
jgi:hypothetical protein